MDKQRFKVNIDPLKASAVKALGSVARYMPKTPDETLGELFAEVQNMQVYSDGKTFVDLIPRRRLQAIRQEYVLKRKDPNFDLREFVTQHFYSFDSQNVSYVYDGQSTIREHIHKLWTVLERGNRRNRGSLIPVPYRYVVPGGRFSEQFYWDSYFIMLGLSVDGKHKMIEGMMKNYAHMIRKFGYIPTANRSYLLSRSQPPFFASMVELLAKHRGHSTYIEYLPLMLAEYRFWQKGTALLRKNDLSAKRRVVQMPDGTLLNRYYDNKKTPRPESLREDIETAAFRADRQETAKLYLDLRAAAESGWDFSSRWLSDPQSLSTIRTTDIVPVDLNCLLYTLEQTIAHAYRLMRSKAFARRFQHAAERRAEAIRKHFWNTSEQFFVDYDIEKHAPGSSVTLAGAFPLYANIATPEQAKQVAKRLEKDFLQPGGLLTTLVNNGQQWDAPNGWAPLQWVTIVGLRNYGYNELADEIKKRWKKLNEDVFTREGRLIEKYDVLHPEKLGGGGEYPLQDGFGWTNGVYAALDSDMDLQ